MEYVHCTRRPCRVAGFILRSNLAGVFVFVATRSAALKAAALHLNHI